MQTSQIDEKAVAERFESKTQKSAALFREASKVTPGGVSAGIKFFDPHPVYMKKAAGSRIWDVDGNEYVDYLMSYGALILGHGHRVVRQAIESVLASVGTTVMGTPTETELEYGRMLVGLFHRDGMIRFTNSGLESTLLAVRLTRAFTGKRKVAKFEGHYQGAVDRVLFSYLPEVADAGSPESPVPVADSVDVDEKMLGDSVALPFNDWESTEAILTRHTKELSCVIMEPFEEGVVPAEKGFMKNLRRLTADLKIPLIFDEVKTGFRVRYGGASEYYSITPDVTCLGKIVGGGISIGAVIGDAEIMKLLDPRGDRHKRVFHSGTFNGNPLSLSVGKATVEELGRDGNFRSLVRRTEDLKKGMSAKLAEQQLTHVLSGEGAMFNFYFTNKPVRNYRDIRASDLRLRRLIDLEMMTHGIYTKPENRYCMTLAHSEDDVSLTLERLEDSLDALIPSSSR